ncbi:CPBP family intramembrane glutamic endopeptidase [Streptococcus pantholopis]|uniref:CAAX protease n=1 Tax=Streptococcus pantholopis TaxID=1811193 RepID=A0A172Q954_9STRE|nr:type II CAAX endopeptidase family protein [Streptococcus pantholopis]AND80033.1 CAAX protease [Streptococcus pantholopis]
MPSFIQAKSRSRFNCGLLLAPIVGVFLLLAGEVSAESFSGWFFQVFPKTSGSSFLLELFSFIFITLIVICWSRLIEGSPWQGFGFSKKHALKDFIWGWILGAGLLSLCVLIMALLGGVTFEISNLSVKTFCRLLVLIPAWSVQGHAEETLVRGWFFSSIAVKHKIVTAVIASSLFFAAIHMGNDGLSLLPVLDLVLFGILASLYLLKTGSIWGISGLHAAWNCFQGNVFSFPVSGSSAGTALIKVSQQGPDWLSGGSFGVEGSLISILVQIIFILLLAYDLFLKKSSRQLKKSV